MRARILAMKTILVTGGAGYIGSHTIVELLQAGHRVVSLDNYSNSLPEALARVRRIAGRDLVAIDGDVRDGALLDRIFATHAIDGVVHFAALKAVGESVREPLAYYDNNVGGTLCLLQAIQRTQLRRLVFSSSATVYGTPDELPLREAHPIRPTNPYGATKSTIEELMRDLAASDASWSLVSLRYFNPIGAHPSGLIGEDPSGKPDNLFPFMLQVAVGKRDFLDIFGNDWPTADGTGVRDYLHVVDLALGHLRALDFTDRTQGFAAINLGTGRGTSVLELVHAFERASGHSIARRFTARRAGDIAACWADPTLATELLGWRAHRTIEQACIDGWRWQQSNPHGYRNADRAHL
jgi:UDP-glucose 4-epimerase